VPPGSGAPVDFKPLTRAERRDLFFRIFPSIMIPMYLAIGDQTTLASALPSIVGSLGEAERVSWIMSAYLVANTIAAPVYGYLGDIMGRRKLMFVALGIYIGAAIFCSLAPNATFLIIGRLVQGFGGGGLMGLSQALVGEAVPARERGNFQGYLAGIGLAATAIGPIMGGFVTEHFGWRYVFLFNVPIAIAAIFLTMRLEARPGPKAKGWRFDVQGLLLFCVFIVPVMFALDRAQRINAESVPVVAALFGLAGVALVLLIRHEKKVEAPLLPIHLFRRRAIWMSNLMVLCQGAMLTSMITFLPIYLRVLRGGSASEAAWLLLPITLGLSIGSVVSGRLMSFTGKTMVIPSITLVPGSLALIDFAIRSPQMPLPYMAIHLGTAAILLGSVMSVVQVSIQSAAGPQMLGAAAGSVQFSRSVGAAFGTALFATALFATLSIRDPGAGEYFTRILDMGPQVLDSLDEARRQTIRDEIQTAFTVGFLSAASFTVLCLVLAWFNPQRRV
jgi:EmrB/QacA subfamily drug resistance transporter